MRQLTWLVRGVRATFARRAGNQDIDEELAFHVASRIDHLVTSGVSKEQATRQARLEFGSRDKAADECREARRFTLVEDLVRDFRHAARSLRKHPGMVATSLLSLAFGIGVNTLLFSAVSAVFFSKPSTTDLHELVWVNPSGTFQLAYLNYQDLERTKGFAALFGYRAAPLSLRTNDGAESVSALVVTPNFFQGLGVTTSLGQLRTETSDRGEANTALISYGFWSRRFGRDPSIVGRQVTINAQPFEISGVLPEDFTPVTLLASPEMYVPISEHVLPNIGSRDDANALNLLGRLHRDHGRERAWAALAAFDADREQPVQRPPQSAVRAGRIDPVGPMRLSEAPLAAKIFPTILGVLCGLVLLIASANVGGLLLTRAMGQQHELALLSALGASRRRVVQRMLAESLLLSLAGTALALMLTLWIMPMLQEIVLPIGSVSLRMRFDWAVACYAALLMFVTGALCGIIPAVTTTRRGAAPLLKEGGTHSRRIRLRQALVVVQTAATVVLLVSAFIFTRTLVRLGSVDTGLDLDRGIVSTITLQPTAGTDRIASKTRQLLEALRQTPGVEASSVAEIVPLTMDMSAARFVTEGNTQPGPRTLLNAVAPRYFTVMGMASVTGRDFDDSDRAGAGSVVIVNQAFASAYFPDGQALGGRVRADAGAYAEIVGIVANNSMEFAGEPPHPQLFYALLQRSVSTQQRPLNVLIRTAGPPAALVRTVHSITSAFDVNAPTKTSTLREATSFEFGIRRIGASILSALGTTGLLLAAIGLYGIVSYMVATRTKELGVRMALGASPSTLRRQVLWRGLRLTLWGLGAGIVLSLIGGRLMTSLLAGLSPADPLSFLGGAIVLILMGIVASYLPARRATRVDPMVVLRQS